MKPTKGLNLDVRPQEQPAGTNPFAKNGIQYDLNGSVFNEPGFRKLAALVPYKIMGIIETDSKPVILSTDNTSSAIGYFNPETELYEAVIDDAKPGTIYWPMTDGSKLGFKAENYIKGQSQRNYKGELVITYTDKVNYPMYLNMDNPAIKSINDFRLFPFFVAPLITVIQTSGGTLLAGAYYVALGYEKPDGTSTGYSVVSPVTLVQPGNIATRGDKSLQIDISNVDQNYKQARIAIISKVNGVTKAVELTDYQQIIGDTIHLVYTGDELSTDISVATVITPQTNYDKVGTMTQLNDYLYIGDLHQEADIDDMQPYANLINLSWQSSLQNALSPSQDIVTGKTKSFTHGEVYAFYVRYRKTRGGTTKWFTIPGPTPSASDLLQAPGFDPGVPSYKVLDPIPWVDGFTGGMGAWQNKNERYPDTIDFDSSAIGGRNLRDQLVIHHKFPSLAFVQGTFYAQEKDFGRSKLDILGVKATNTIIPDKYKNSISGYEIGYAIRTVNNQTMNGQALLFNWCATELDEGRDGGDLLPSSTALLYTTGGNWETQIFRENNNTGQNKFQLQGLRQDTFRMHPFDVLFFKPAINPTHIQGICKLRASNLDSDATYIEDGDVVGQGKNTGPMEYIIDYATSTDDVNFAGTVNKYNKITKSYYDPNSVNIDNFVNFNAESAFIGLLSGTPFGISDDIQQVKWHPTETQTKPQDGLFYSEAWLSNLFTLKDDVYTSYASQKVASIGPIQSLTQHNFQFGGDTFISPYSFHTYGRYDSNDTDGGTTKGIKTVQRIVCESVANINARYVDPANVYSDYWPKTPLSKDTPGNYLTNFQRAEDPNQFGYSKDYNSINDLSDSTIYSPYVEYIYTFPYRIHRGGKASRQSRPRSWRTFLPLDYYEMQKNMGKLINLEGMDDKLIIHMENSMFLTQDKTQLSSGSLGITLGSGDIFQFEPQEAISSKLGYAGTQHDLACVRTPFGYTFLDARQGEMYIYKGQLSLINEGVNTFLREWARLKEKNPYIGNGVTIGWDQKYKRILLTIKNRILNDPSKSVKVFNGSDDFFNSLKVGDAVLYQGRLIQYLGLNTSPYVCPPDPVVHTTTWSPTDPYCLTDSASKLTGYKGYHNRIRLTDGVADGYTEGNTEGGLGIFFPPVLDKTTCVPTPPTITWKGTDGDCLASGSVNSCGTGFTYNATLNKCVKHETSAVIPSSGGSGTAGTATPVNDYQWNNGGANVYAPGFPTSGEGTVAAYITTPHLFVNGNAPYDAATRNYVDGRMNRAGIWVAGGVSTTGGDYTPLNEYVGFSRKITVSSPKTIYVGVSADNDFRLTFDSVTVVDTSGNNGNLFGAANFGKWNIYPFQLHTGDNFIGMLARNQGSVAGFAAEIYDATIAQLQAATTETDLHLLFSTKDVIGQPFDLGSSIGSSCAAGYSLDTSGPTPVCVRDTYQDPTVTTGTGSGQLAYATRCRLTNGVLDGFCEPNAPGPNYVAPVASAACLPPDAPQTPANLTGTIAFNCPDTNCTIPQATAQVRITLSTALKYRITVLMGVIVKKGTGSFYVGSSVFPGAGVTTGKSFDSANYDSDLPFEIDIPAGKTEINLIGPLGQFGGSDSWTCNHCSFPITDVYVKLDQTSLDPKETNAYTLAFSTFTSGVTLHNVN